ncbi:hypothetical protein EGI22_01475 [Lacihabitans sp. LS3-19]|uniref:hypothetical protein n=1 Tax=Lacihabitans sp. LS3-19 TaxID=2487335 RepID=UPI0020CEEFCD|nr:hypothetical protein [Lacihabitans sp. LS3-19]MCP9766559.1 hypothetical protein [Lacihabitans sp. LS3-19]
MRLAIFLFFVSAQVFGGNLNDSIPKFAIKYNPIPLFLEYDLHYQFVGEYFIDAKQSVQFTYGFGNHRILKNSENDKMSMFRLEYKRFFRPFNPQKKARGYWGPEIMYKRALVPEDASPAIGFNLPPYPRHFFVNVAAFHLKLGREHIDLKNFPVFEAFFGAGVRGFNNFLGYTPSSGYEKGYPASGMFGRSPGKGITPSAVIGIGIGFGKWRK